MQIKITLITIISMLYYLVMDHFFPGKMNKIDFIFPTIISCLLIIKSNKGKRMNCINDIIYSTLIIIMIFIFL